jgi:hypothetical protein
VPCNKCNVSRPRPSRPQMAQSTSVAALPSWSPQSISPRWPLTRRPKDWAVGPKGVRGRDVKPHATLRARSAPPLPLDSIHDGCLESLPQNSSHRASTDWQHSPSRAHASDRLDRDCESPRRHQAFPRPAQHSKFGPAAPCRAWRSHTSFFVASLGVAHNDVPPGDPRIVLLGVPQQRAPATTCHPGALRVLDG